MKESNKMSVALASVAGICVLGVGAIGLFHEKDKEEKKNTQSLESKTEEDIRGQVYQVDQRELTYIADNSNRTPINVSITFLGVQSEGKKYDFILVGPNNIKLEDKINMHYKIQEKVDSEKIWENYYNLDIISHRIRMINCPKISFDTDGLVTSWRKYKETEKAEADQPQK